MDADLIKSWLRTALVDEHLEDFTVNLAGTSDKGEGYLGDIIFVKVSGTTRDGSPKTYDLVMKCSKTNQTLRTVAPIRAIFQNEIYFYSEILPAFTRFQEERCVNNVFNSIPKYYGHCLTDNREIIVLENMKTQGYELHDVRQPLSRKHLILALEQYAKLHAISAAFGDQCPQEFETLTKGLINMMLEFNKTICPKRSFEPHMEDTYDLIKDELPEDTCKKWLDFKDQIEFVFLNLCYDSPGFKVVSHGDAWNNNLLFKHEKIEDQVVPTEAILLDWQMAYYLTPVRELSFFLYSCISKEDLEDFDDILKHYYEHFSGYLRELGSEPDSIYPFNQLLDEWKVFSKNGLLFSIISVKFAVTEKQELADWVETAEKEKDISTVFCYGVRNKAQFKYRMKYLIEHCVERGFI